MSLSVLFTGTIDAPLRCPSHAAVCWVVLPRELWDSGCVGVTVACFSCCRPALPSRWSQLPSSQTPVSGPRPSLCSTRHRWACCPAHMGWPCRPLKWGVGGGGLTFRPTALVTLTPKHALGLVLLCETSQCLWVSCERTRPMTSIHTVRVAWHLLSLLLEFNWGH